MWVLSMKCAWFAVWTSKLLYLSLCTVELVLRLAFYLIFLIFFLKKGQSWLFVFLELQLFGYFLNGIFNLGYFVSLLHYCRKYPLRYQLCVPPEHVGSTCLKYKWLNLKLQKSLTFTYFSLSLLHVVQRTEHNPQKWNAQKKQLAE